MLSGEATTTNFIIFGLQRPGLKLTIYRTRGDHVNLCATIAGFGEGWEGVMELDVRVHIRFLIPNSIPTNNEITTCERLKHLHTTLKLETLKLFIPLKAPHRA